MVLNNKKDSMADDPPYSRLFVIYNKKDPINETKITSDFSQFGNIEDVFLVKDKRTGEYKGVAYVKFSKMSEAALAMEKLSNKSIKGHSGTYKVFIAKSRGEAKGSEHDDPDRYLRLFITIPKSATEDDIRKHFSKYGEVLTVKLLKNRETNESRGLGYVTYSRVYEAAKAVEDGDNESGFKAVIARPKEKQFTVESTSSHKNGPRSAINESVTSDSFHATVSSKLNKDQIFHLFDVAPGLRNIQIVAQNAYQSDILATYNSALAAEYALNKLQQVEYPLGDHIYVESKMINKSLPSSDSFLVGKRSGKRDYRGDSISDYNKHEQPVDREMNQKLSALTKVLSDATALLKSAGVSTDSLGFSEEDDRWSTSRYCNFQVPPLQKCLEKSAFSEATGMRLFIVGHPAAPSLEALYDVYCRFGNFAGASILQKKNYGYLYFCCPESARKAIDATDEKLIEGMNIKILKAEPKGEPSNKRSRNE